MTCDSLLSNKYVFCKYEHGNLHFWLENASGYTDELYHAGIFTKEDIERFGLEALTVNDFKEERHVKLIHYAVSIATMLVLACLV